MNFLHVADLEWDELCSKGLWGLVAMLANSVSQFVWMMLLLSECRLQTGSGLSSWDTPWVTWNTAGDDWSSCTSCSSGKSSVTEVQRKNIQTLKKYPCSCILLCTAAAEYLSENKQNACINGQLIHHFALTDWLINRKTEKSMTPSPYSIGPSVEGQPGEDGRSSLHLGSSKPSSMLEQSVSDSWTLLGTVFTSHTILHLVTWADWINRKGNNASIWCNVAQKA